MSTGLSTLIAKGCAAALEAHAATLRADAASEPALALLRLSELPRRCRDPRIPLDEQDQLVAALLRCYRTGRSEGWAALVLEMLGPGLCRVLDGLHSTTPSISEEDLSQHLILEALLAAKSAPLIDPRYLQRRLILRARTAVMRWLRRASRTSEPGLMPTGEADLLGAEAARFALADLGADGISASELAVAYRTRVMGEPLAQVAAAAGITADALRSRRRRTEARLGGHRLVA